MKKMQISCLAYRLYAEHIDDIYFRILDDARKVYDFEDEEFSYFSLKLASIMRSMCKRTGIDFSNTNISEGDD